MTKSKSEGGLGFRELQNFNGVLLANMAAQALNEPSALWVRVIKGLYFTSSDFLHAKKGSSASWGWSSLLSGRDTIKEEGVLLIGDGRLVRQFSDHWVHTHSGFSVLNMIDNAEGTEEEIVDGWINQGCWRHDAVR